LLEALIETETNGIKREGQSGELASYTQMLPSTWKAIAIDTIGYVPELTEVNEKYVVARTLEKWVAKGLTDEQIYLKWNSGQYKVHKQGINKWGQRYDTIAYTQKALKNLQL